MSTRRAVTFDFHDTLASCDRWFQMEVRTLPATVVGRMSPGSLTGAGVDPDAITDAYRALRAEIVGHGLEMDALAGVRETLRRVGLAADDDDVSPVIDELMREATADVRPMPGAVETLTALHRAGFALGVVSSAVYHPFLLWALEEFGVLPLLTTVVTSASAGFYKSRPEIYERALDDLGTRPADACHVGDSVRWDHLTAKSLGIRTVLVSPEEPALEEGQPPPDLRIPSLVDAARSIAELVDSPPTHSAPR